MGVKITGNSTVDDVISWSSENSDYVFEIIKRTGTDQSDVIKERTKKGKNFPPTTEANAGLHCRPLDFAVPYLPPIFLWFLSALAMIPFLIVNGIYGLLKLFVAPFLHDWWIQPVSEEAMMSAVEEVLAKCDKLEDELGPADPTGLSKGKVYPAVAMNGLAHKSTRYFGYFYYLIKHDLIDYERTHIFGYSMATIVVTACQAACRPATKERRIDAFKQILMAWMKYGVEFLPNFPLHLNLNAMSDPLFAGIKKAIDRVNAENNIRPGPPKNLHLVLTRVFNLNQPCWPISDFDNWDDLVEVCKGSCAIPFQMGFTPWNNVRGVRCIDGGYSCADVCPDQTNPKYTPCMHGRIFPLEGAEAVFGHKSHPLLLAVLDVLRLPFPLVRTKDYAADIAEGYRAAHRIHKCQLSLLNSSQN